MTSFMIILNPFSRLLIDKSSTLFQNRVQCLHRKKSKIVENSNKQKIDLWGWKKITLRWAYDAHSSQTLTKKLKLIGIA